MRHSTPPNFQRDLTPVTDLGWIEIRRVARLWSDRLKQYSRAKARMMDHDAADESLLIASQLDAVVAQVKLWPGLSRTELEHERPIVTGQFINLKAAAQDILKAWEFI